MAEMNQIASSVEAVLDDADHGKQRHDARGRRGAAVTVGNDLHLFAKPYGDARLQAADQRTLNPADAADDRGGVEGEEHPIPAQRGRQEHQRTGGSGGRGEARASLRANRRTSGRMGFEIFDKVSWGQTEFDEKVNYQRALEGELERTITTLANGEERAGASGDGNRFGVCGPGARGQGIGDVEARIAGG